MSSADTAQPPPLEDPKIVTPSSSSAASSASPPDGTATEDSSKSSPGLSPSTWKPNADAAEWKPTFSTVSAPVPAVGGDSDGTKVDDGEEKRGKALGEGGATDAGVGDVKEGGRGDGKRKVGEYCVLRVCVPASARIYVHVCVFGVGVQMYTVG